MEAKKLAQAAIQGTGYETLTSLEGGLVNLTSHIAADTQMHADFSGVDDMGMCDTQAHLTDIAALGDRRVGMENGVVGPFGKRCIKHRKCLEPPVCTAFTCLPTLIYMPTYPYAYLP